MLEGNLSDRRDGGSKVMAGKLKRLSEDRKSALKASDPVTVTLAPEKAVQKLTDICKCTYCNFWLQEPVEASCGHLFCASCLLQISELNHMHSGVACPCCSVKISSRNAKSRNDIKDLVCIKMQLENVLRKELGSSNEILPDMGGASKVTKMAEKLKHLSENSKFKSEVTDSLTTLIQPEKAVEKLTDICKCTFCTCWLQDPVEASCGHVFCSSCLLRPSELKISSIACPCCSVKISCRSAKPRDDISDLVRTKIQLENVLRKELTMTSSDEILSNIKDPEPGLEPVPMYPLPLTLNVKSSEDIEDLIRGKIQRQNLFTKELTSSDEVLCNIKDPQPISVPIPPSNRNAKSREGVQNLVGRKRQLGNVFTKELTNSDEILRNIKDPEPISVPSPPPTRNPKSREDIQELVGRKRQLGNVFTKELTNSDEILRNIKDPQPIPLRVMSPPPTRIVKSGAEIQDLIRSKRQRGNVFTNELTDSDEILCNINEPEPRSVPVPPSTRNVKSREAVQNLVGRKRQLGNMFTKELTNSDEILCNIKEPEPIPVVSAPTSRNIKSRGVQDLVGRTRQLGNVLTKELTNSDEILCNIKEPESMPPPYTRNAKSRQGVQDLGRRKTQLELDNVFQKELTDSEKILCNINEPEPLSVPVPPSTRNVKSRAGVQDWVDKTRQLGNVLTKELTNSEEILCNIKTPESISISVVPPPVPTQGSSKMTSSDEFLYNVVDKSAENGHEPKEYVFCPTRLNKKQTAKLNELCKMCNGQIRKKYSLDVTHLVIQLTNGRVPQTLKYLLAIAGRKWVIIYDWVEKCVETGKLLPEDEYETSNFKHCDAGVKLSRLSKTNLFDGFKFYFATDNFKQLGFTFDEVLMLMQTLGAEVLPSVENIQDSVLIVGHSKGNTTEYYNWLHTKQWLTVTFEWLIECVLEYRLLPFTSKHTCINITNHELETANVPKSLQICISQHLTE